MIMYAITLQTNILLYIDNNIFVCNLFNYHTFLRKIILF